MPSVPERPLSYGELLHNLRLKHKARMRQKEQSKNVKPKNKRDRTKYSYEDIKKHVDNL